MEKNLLLSLIIAVAVVLLIPLPVFAQDVYIQIDELPDWADYASNVMYLSTEAWKDANEGLQFYKVDSGSDFTVKWVREFGGEYVGYAYGNQFIEVGLGDSNCGNQWNPYSERYMSHIMKHEIGHIFGNEHDNNPDSIMYPVALNLEYGVVEEEYRLTAGYGQFVPFCTIKDLTSYEFSFSTTDETYGFDYYIVPSGDEFDKWVESGTFQHYSNKDCFGEGWLSISGTCKGVSAGSGIMILLGEDLTSPLVTITVKQYEQPNIINSKSPLSSKSITTQGVFSPVGSNILDSVEQARDELQRKLDDIEYKRIHDEAVIKLQKEKQEREEALENKLREEKYQAEIQQMRETQQKIEEKTVSSICGTGTILKDGQCVPDYPNTEPSSKGGGCLIATATYGSELAPQVQQLRELRDNSLLNTESGTSFMESFNDFYYSFSPIIADYERENPLFKEIVKIAITPMVLSLSILNYVDMNSEIEVLGYGISLIILNVGMYVGIPAILIIRIRKGV